MMVSFNDCIPKKKMEEKKATTIKADPTGSYPAELCEAMKPHQIQNEGSERVDFV